MLMFNRIEQMLILPYTDKKYPAHMYVRELLKQENKQRVQE